MPPCFWVLVVTEWLYFDWASRAPKPPPHNFVHAEWIPPRVTGLEIICGEAHPNALLLRSWR